MKPSPVAFRVGPDPQAVQQPAPSKAADDLGWRGKALQRALWTLQPACGRTGNPKPEELFLGMWSR